MLPRHWAMKFWAIQCLPPTAKGSGGNGVTLNHRHSRWVTASLLPRFSTREGQGGGIKNLFCSSAQYHSLALHNPFNPPRLRDNANRGRTSGSENTASCIQVQNKERDGAWKGQGNTLRTIFFTRESLKFLFHFSSVVWFILCFFKRVAKLFYFPAVQVNFDASTYHSSSGDWCYDLVGPLTLDSHTGTLACSISYLFFSCASTPLFLFHQLCLNFLCMVRVWLAELSNNGWLVQLSKEHFSALVGGFLFCKNDLCCVKQPLSGKLSLLKFRLMLKR